MLDKKSFKIQYPETSIQHLFINCKSVTYKNLTQIFFKILDYIDSKAVHASNLQPQTWLKSIILSFSPLSGDYRSEVILNMGVTVWMGK